MPSAPTSFYGVELDPEIDAQEPTTDELMSLFGILKPRVSATPLIRIGADIDGAYLVPDDLAGITACYSPGVNRIKFFEDHLADRYGIASHMCDFTCAVEDFTTPVKAGVQTFQKKWLDPEPGPDNIRLDDWVRETEGDLLLQMDIEGAEYRNVLAASDETLARFRVMVLEIHGLGKALEAPALRGVIAPFFAKLAASFTCLHAHPNNCCGDFAVPGTDIRIPHVIELTLVRNDHFRPAPGTPSLPHPLDVSRNVPRKPPLFLSEAWCDHERPLESRVKILEDTLRFRDEVGTPNADEGMAGVLGLTMQSLQTLLDATPGTPSPPGGLVDAAAGRPYRLSTSYGSTRKSGKVAARTPYFFHTEFGSNQSIRVDLGGRRMVRRIEVSNRTDGFQDRARFIFASLSDNGDAAARVFPLYQADDLPRGGWQELSRELPDVSARFVTIVAPANTALHFSDLRILVADDTDDTDDSAPDTASTSGTVQPTTTLRRLRNRFASALRGRRRTPRD